MSYHHGNVPGAALELVDQIVREGGVTAVTLRDLGQRLNVTHSAVVHHFGSRTGVLTAFAVQGYELLGRQVQEAGGSFLDVGVTFVAFAAKHPSHFAVMYSPSLLDPTDPDLVAAQQRSLSRLVGSAAGRTGTDGERARSEALAGWALMHGLASLHATGALRAGGLVDVDDTDDLLDAARRVGRLLFGPHPAPPPQPDET